MGRIVRRRGGSCWCYGTAFGWIDQTFQAKFAFVKEFFSFLILLTIVSAVNVKDGARQELIIETCKVIDGLGNVLRLTHAVHRMDGGDTPLVVGTGLNGVL